jgi:hypothetical protein
MYKYLLFIIALFGATAWAGEGIGNSSSCTNPDYVKAIQNIQHLTDEQVNVLKYHGSRCLQYQISLKEATQKDYLDFLFFLETRKNPGSPCVNPEYHEKVRNLMFMSPDELQVVIDLDAQCMSALNLGDDYIASRAEAYTAGYAQIHQSQKTSKINLLAAALQLIPIPLPKILTKTMIPL